MRTARLALLLFVMGVYPAAAQVPTVSNTAVAARDEPLPVLDDDGVVIPEPFIEAAMRPPLNGFMRFLARTTMGIAAATFLASRFDTPGRDCSIYEPCSDREKMQKSASPWFGFAIGVMASYAVISTGYDRLEAVERIRAERRRAKASSTP